jgi:hypothetical protein
VTSLFNKYYLKGKKKKKKKKKRKRKISAINEIFYIIFNEELAHI